MSNTSLGPWLDVDVPDLDTLAWKQIVRLAWVRSREIVDQRLQQSNAQGNAQGIEIWKVRDFEYRHFYSGWVGLAFRFRACAAHDQTYIMSFDQYGGDVMDMAMYQEDEALFGFFLKGLAALECFCYGLYALGTLVRTPTQAPSIPPQPLFPHLDPHDPKEPQAITPRVTLQAFQQHFAGYALTTQLARMLADPAYREWSNIRNVVAHRAATAGRSLRYSNPSALVGGDDARPSAVTMWAGDIDLTADTTASRYRWLRETLNTGIEATLAFTKHELPYPEAQLPSL